MEYSKDIVNVPSYLTKDFFEEILENGLRTTNVTIEKMQMEMGSCTGENYCSQIYRVRISYKETHNEDKKLKHFGVIIKSMPQSEITTFLLDLQVFLKEKIFYQNVLPKMELFLEGEQKFGARLYHSLKHPIKTLAFEDLSTIGYQLASRELGLDEAHSCLVLKKLGQFHAISMVLAKKEPKIMDCFDTGMLARTMLDRDGGLFLKYLAGNAEALVALVNTWPGYEDITNRIRRYNSDLRENLWRCQAPIVGELKVLNHGDLWVNNILFKYGENKKLRDVVFVDFQMSIWSSPGLDLNYFFHTSLQLDVLQHKRDVLIGVYHDSLQRTLRHLQYQAAIPTLQDILAEVNRRELFGFYASYGIFPIVTADKKQSQDTSFDNMQDEEFARKKVQQMFATKRLGETLKYTLKRFDKLKIWDE